MIVIGLQNVKQTSLFRLACNSS